jgi:acetoin utilization deacetylase AcuC-like enzyme
MAGIDGCIMTVTAYITHPACFKHEMGPDHPECPARLDAIHDHLLTRGYLDLMVPYSAPEVTHDQLLRVHTARHVAELEAHAPAQGYYQVDPDTLMNPYSLAAARRAAGAVVMAADLVLSGEATQAFCAVRPPGHHAVREAAMGFCFFNNVAVGIRHGQRKYGVKRIALIDFDVHHGNGSEDVFAGDDGVLMVSTFQQHLYPFEGDVPKGANMVNVPLPARSRSDGLRQAVSTVWLPALEKFAPEMLFISAGFDAHIEDDMGNLGWQDADYAWLTARLSEVAARHCRGRIISTLEGGYALPALARSVGLHVGVLIGAVDA